MKWFTKIRNGAALFWVLSSLWFILSTHSIVYQLVFFPSIRLFRKNCITFIDRAINLTEYKNKHQHIYIKLSGFNDKNQIKIRFLSRISFLISLFDFNFELMGEAIKKKKLL